MTDRIAALEAEVDELKAALGHEVRDHGKTVRMLEDAEAGSGALRASLLAAQVEREGFGDTMRTIQTTADRLAIETSDHRLDCTCPQCGIVDELNIAIATTPPNAPALLKAAEGMAEAIGSEELTRMRADFSPALKSALAAWRAAVGRG